MAAKRTMIITWLDGKQESYPFTHQETRNGELHIWTEYPGAITYKVYNERWFTIDNIRTRTETDA